MVTRLSPYLDCGRVWCLLFPCCLRCVLDVSHVTDTLDVRVAGKLPQKESGNCHFPRGRAPPMRANSGVSRGTNLFCFVPRDHGRRRGTPAHSCSHPPVAPTDRRSHRGGVVVGMDRPTDASGRQSSRKRCYSVRCSFRYIPFAHQCLRHTNSREAHGLDGQRAREIGVDRGKGYGAETLRTHIRASSSRPL